MVKNLIPNEFGLFVTSNISLSHIVFGESNKTPCGLIHKIVDTKHPNSEIRWYKTVNEFGKWIVNNRWSPYPGWRLCKKCLAAYDKLEM